ncbi:hypothetical protein GH741_13435 [Aquibacillus halophilus]|uniref:Uncharacterized protein n=1 Tax=Aquibacillus halophilus TaxID=930132 RepID=A0A6A8DDM6_9BACI|nr:hypothetical protein [Aquibacillus halophilus]MRH43674.1 hypothetical protein [Aquibacillus halophilus]
MLFDWSIGQSTPAGKATAENPAGSVFLPRKLKRCPRKATARSENHHNSYDAVYRFYVINDKFG